VVPGREMEGGGGIWRVVEVDRGWGREMEGDGGWGEGDGC